MKLYDLPRALFGVVLLALVPMQAMADDVAAELAAEAAREFDSLVPSVKQAANRLFDAVRKSNRQQKSPPAVDWTTKFQSRQYFTRPDNQHIARYTETAYTVTAVQRGFQYRLGAITKIMRTGKRNAPFSASVEIEVTVATQTAEIVGLVPIPVPKGYRKIKIARYLLAIEAEEPPEHVAMLGVSHCFPIPCSINGSTRDVENAPESVQKIVVSARKACALAKPIKSQETHTVIFVYSLKERRWLTESEQ